MQRRKLTNNFDFNKICRTCAKISYKQQKKLSNTSLTIYIFLFSSIKRTGILMRGVKDTVHRPDPAHGVAPSCQMTGSWGHGQGEADPATAYGAPGSCWT